MKKTLLLDSLANLPDEVSIDEIIEQLVVIEKIEEGRRQVKEGRVNTEDQAKARFSKWCV